MKVLSSVALTFLVAYLAQAAPLPAQGETSELQARGEYQHGHYGHHHHHQEQSVEARGEKTDAAKNKASKATRVTKEALGKAKHPVVKALGGPPMVKQIKPSERRPNFADRRSLELEARGEKTDAAKNKAAKATRVTKEALGKAKHPVVKALGGPPMVKQIKPSERRPNFADRRSLELEERDEQEFLEARGEKTDAAKNKAAKATRVTKEALGKAKHPVVKALGGPPMVKQIKPSERRPNFADRRSLETRGEKTDAAKNKAAKATRVTKEALGKAKHPVVKALGGPPMVKQIKPSERRPNFAD